MNSIYWLIALAVFLVFEIATLGLTTIWFSGGALIAFLISLFMDNFVAELVVFLVVSFVLLFFTRPVAAKYFNKQRTKTNYESLIGKEAKITIKVDNINASGQAVLNGQEWAARSVDDSVIEPGERVIVRNISGVKLIVEVEEEI